MMKSNTCANNVDLDEMVRNEQSHKDLHCLVCHSVFDFRLKHFFAAVNKSKSRLEESG